MKKTKFLIIGVVVALMLVGGAYAAWTSQAELTVNASAGELDVQISDVSIDDVSEYVEFDKKSVQISEDKKSASVSVENLYPGAAVTATLEISNNGTMAIALDKAIQKRIEVVDTETNKQVDVSIMKALVMNYTGTIQDAKGKIIDNIGSAKVNGHAKSSSFFKNNKTDIKPGEKVVIQMTISMKESAKNDSQNKLFKFSVTPIFTQGS